MMTTATPTTATDLISGGGPTIFVRDLEKSIAFYRDVLGMALAFQAGPHYAEVDAGEGLRIGLHPPASNAKTPGTPGSIQVALNVRQPIEHVVKTLKQRGVKFDIGADGNEVRDDGAVKLAFFRDPDGNELYLCEVKP